MCTHAAHVVAQNVDEHKKLKKIIANLKNERIFFVIIVRPSMLRTIFFAHEIGHLLTI
jgi:abortive infection bacteriophage resistance protein